MSAKKDMLNRLAGVARSAPLQENGTVEPANEAMAAEPKAATVKAKPVRKSKNLLIPEDLWEAYEGLKNSNSTSLLMTPYIIEAFREKLARDGAFENDK
ncbi:molecular chaperone [Salmonella enterica]|uniref:Molecular chaperone n=1 Tax=Salmonella enterica TaxID=28901 RepID=A0A402TQZ8_SALER|nr:molecular chaperone [Salmonella enterica]EBM0753719.1 molecular chaperone [Salmonella enterica subsp. enterica serovar Give]EBQ0715312.1 molecular chaperone [Salmonella enterica subsp. enterica]ECS7504435.1 molecular chaperone [Salmonella enterica subsp. enterica serovar Newport]ECS8506549.1 molecular chaperone [Salmonella enterica subsp. enterica serovar Muenchen]EDK5699236.1 molecular chaperone [Salmonella enterica subsp. enterica serovar Montevideo]EDQ7877643.1 molecular chaperone [Salm